MRCVLLFSVLSASLAWSATAQATVDVAIDLTRQRMHVRGAGGTFDWPISSARSGFSTPGGSYAPIRLEAMHYSHKYHMSPMPYSIFFRGGYAIHGTYSTASLGRPASHGCVRLAPGNAARLFQMVKSEGARISISGTPPRGPATTYARAPRMVEAEYGEAPVSRAPRYDRPRRAATAADIYAAYGYRYVGQMNGHRVYQAPAVGYEPAYGYQDRGYGYRDGGYGPE